MLVKPILTAVFLFAICPTLSGQLVQLPQREDFGVDTAVSVPDRGGLLLGGVSQGASGRQVYGPLPWGSSWGQSYSNTTAWSHVWIHDLQAMDEAILAEAAARRLRKHLVEPVNSAQKSESPAVLEQAEQARQQLILRSKSR